MVVGYSFDGLGYLPDSASFDDGGYEVLSCRYARGAGELFAEKVIELINKQVIQIKRILDQEFFFYYLRSPRRLTRSP